MQKIKTKFIILNIILLISIVPSAWSQAGRDSCSVIYVANEGFLIETGNHKVLIDALFGDIKGDWCAQPDDSVAALMLNGIAPFDNIDVVLVTHKHSDHFKADMVIDFLKNNTKSVLVCPDQVNDLLMQKADYAKVSDRIISVKLGNISDSSLFINNITVHAMKIKHGSYFEKDSVTGNMIDLHINTVNLGYLVTSDGYTVFHSGDDSPSNKEQYKLYDFGKNKIDIAFLDRVYLRKGGMDVVIEYIHTRDLVFMHIEPKNLNIYQAIKTPPGELPQIFVFSKSLERKRFSEK